MRYLEREMDKIGTVSNGTYTNILIPIRERSNSEPMSFARALELMKVQPKHWNLSSASQRSRLGILFDELSALRPGS